MRLRSRGSRSLARQVIPSAARTGAIRLRDGRSLAFAEWGPPDGRLSPAAAQRALSSGFPKVDRAVVGRPEVGSRLLSAYLDATRPGGRGLAEDMRILLNTWGFDPAEIRAPAHLLHGRLDRVTPPAHAEHWIEVLDNVHPVWIEDAGHLLIEDHVEQIVATLSA